MGNIEKIILAGLEERKRGKPTFPGSQDCQNRPGTELGILCVRWGPRYLLGHTSLV